MKIPLMPNLLRLILMVPFLSGSLAIGADPVVTEAQVTFETTSNDKDHDTAVVACLELENGLEIGCTEKLVGRRFADGSSNGPYTVRVVRDKPGHPKMIRVQITPNGNDTWMFRVYVRWKVKTGDVFDGRSTDFYLTQNERQQTMSIK
jgi:hypothetical protein